MTCIVCGQECDPIEDVNLCDMMEALICANKYLTCCNCFQYVDTSTDARYRLRWRKHFKEIDNGYRPVDEERLRMVKDLYDSCW